MGTEPNLAPWPEWHEVNIWRDLGSPPITPDGTCWVIPER
ncbi:hypothetical protein JOF34_002511 [Microbacterium amylolyticum]|uniref:Uncharacterized protein n=1 Tax=Microbacterium amylolyticum TaxID=936337 RepID=A0ABS4ZKX5_9MICO|nr:hypothetical protein [Microbacterium amylolyticum]